MRRRLPPLNALKAFEAPVRHASFTRAADERAVTHGAVSPQVQALEAWLGFPLFERHKRRVALTPAGASYLADVGAALDRIALATANQIERGRPRVLRVGALATFALRWPIPSLPARSYRLYVPAAGADDPAVRAFRGWIVEAGRGRMDLRP